MTDNNAELNLTELIRVLLSFRWLVIGAATFCTLLAIILALVATPIYRAEVLVAASDDGSSGNPISSLISGVPNIAGLNVFGNRSGGKIAEGIAILRSPQFTVEFIEENDLLHLLFPDKWDAEAGAWDVDQPGQAPSLLDGYAVFNEKIRRIREEDDGIVSVAVEWSDPQRAADWSNMLIQKLNLRMRQRAIDEANRTISFLEAEVQKTNVVEIQQAIYSMMENQLNTRTVASVREEYAFRVISPALPPDTDKFIKPQRAFMVVLGGIIGVALGVFLAFLVYGIRRIKADLA